MGVKQKVITEIFLYCKKAGNFIFDNELVKEICKKWDFRNPFDVTKISNTSLLPEALLDEDYFIVHIGKGKHKFVKGIKKGFHEFEEIKSDSIIPWKYRQSILNELDTSEANILSVASNQKIIHDFLYKDITANPKVYNSRRTNLDISYHIGPERIIASNLQMEIDLTMELRGAVTVFEGKNGFPKDFAVYQLFHPFIYYSTLKKKENLRIKQITCCYILRKKIKGNSVLRLYNYFFGDENDMGSIKLLKSAEYNLIKR